MVDYLDQRHGNEADSSWKVISYHFEDEATFLSYSEMFDAIESEVETSKDSGAKKALGDIKKYNVVSRIADLFEDGDARQKSRFGSMSWTGGFEDEHMPAISFPPSEIINRLFSECKDQKLRIALARICYYSARTLEAPYVAACGLRELQVGKLGSGDNWDVIFTNLYEQARFSKNSPKEACQIAVIVLDDRNGDIGVLPRQKWLDLESEAFVATGRQMVEKTVDLNSSEIPGKNEHYDSGYIEAYAHAVLLVASKVGNRDRDRQVVRALGDLVTYYKLNGFFKLGVKEGLDETAFRVLQTYMVFAQKAVDEILEGYYFPEVNHFLRQASLVARQN